MTANLKAVKGDNPDNERFTQTIKIRGVEYTIRDLDVSEYDECLEAAEQEDKSVPFGKLLRVMTLRAVSPLIPRSYPAYRTLEGIVNEMHFLDLPDENKAETPDEPPAEEEKPPNAD